MYHASNIMTSKYMIYIHCQYVSIHSIVYTSENLKCEKKPSSLKLSNSSYTSRALTSNDTKETQHKFHKEKKFPTLTIMI